MAIATHHSAQGFCSFCLKSQHEEKLIDTTRNSLLIDNKCYEFSSIFENLLGFTSSDESICETCKDLMVSFYLFKRNIKFPHTYITKLLLKNHIDEFLNQNLQNIEDIKVFKTANSITLQQDKAPSDIHHQNSSNIIKSEFKPEIVEQEEENDEFDDDSVDNMSYEALVSYHCSKCDKIETSENDSELHEFLRHSSFGSQIQIEIDNSRAESTDNVDEIIYICGFCTLNIERFDLLLLHLLNNHNPELLFQINEALNIPSHLIEFTVINSYLSHIKDCLQHEKFNGNYEYENKRYFYDIYGEMDEEDLVSDRDVIQEVEINDISDTLDLYSINKIKKEKNERLTDDLSLNDKEWVRTEISRSKCLVNTVTGEKRAVFRCSVTESCNHISNSGPGLRYHLIMKHLKHRQEFQDRKLNQPMEIIETFPFYAKNSSKNCCTDCSLKFKDSRSLQLHERCHDLFSTIANYSHSIFPACNTCNQKFLGRDHLQQHLAKHDANEDLFEPIETEIGALRQQGKILNDFVQSYGETDLTDYIWKCGHCENKNFSKEEYCNLHLLLFHTVSFICPVDKMEFSGFKSVSLFVHHLRNKHSELFPNLSFKCTFCQNEFPSIYDKLNHMKICDRKNLQCDHCDKRFWKKGDLIAHLKFVTGEVQYECPTCNKKCISLSDLKIHLRSHTKIKPYKCSLCTKSFRTLAARSAHVDGHNSNLVFSCEICNKSFKQRHLYRRHMKSIHENKGTDISR